MSRKRVGLIISGAIVIALIVAACSSLNSPAAAPSVPPSSAKQGLTDDFGVANVTTGTTNRASPGQPDNSQGGDIEVQSQPTSQPAQPSAPQKRIVLKNASLELVVQDTAAKIAAISGLADKMGGWVVTSSTYQSAGRAGKPLTYGSISIRVPAEQLDSAMAQIKAGVVSVTSEKTTGSDVTSQYVDMSSHLTNLQAAEEQLRKIMDAATKTEDVLAVYQKLVDIRGQIEQIKGQLTYYDQAAAFSSIDISLTPSDDNQPIVIAGWQPGNTFNSAVSTLIQLVQGSVDLLIWFLIVILPFLVVIMILVLLFRRARTRFAPVRVTPPAPPAPAVEPPDAA